MFSQASLNHCGYHPQFSVVKGDIRVEKTMASLLKEADVIIPLAALVGAPLCNLDLVVPPPSTTTHHPDAQALFQGSDRAHADHQ